MKVDWLIVGAGFTGAVLAERIARISNQKVLLVDKRNHIGGNAYDYYDEHGVLVHQYGPHIFHTNMKKVWDYLSQFTQWHHYQHKVLAFIDGQEVPLPFNFNTLSKLLPRPYAQQLEQQLLDAFEFGDKTPILKLREQSSGDLKFLADYIYDKVFHNYTKKQWNLLPEELGKNVTGRVPISLNRDDRYFQDPYQGLPKHGYTKMFEQLLNHPNIHVMLNTDYHDIENEIEFDGLVYTGLIDTFFDYKFGELPYRSLDFKFFYDEQVQKQAVATVNYPNDFDYTRITEFKHMTGQKHHGTTWIEEYPQAYVRGENDPYYPIPKQEYRDLYQKYLAEAEKLDKKVLFAGRLADYQYYNMDQAVARALNLFEKQIQQT